MNNRVQKHHRQNLNRHNSFILWFTGLSGAGKTTLAQAVELRLHADGVRTYLLDGDHVRQGLCRDLGFGDAHRSENIRRIGEVAKLMVDAGLVVLTAFISPFATDRRTVRSLVSAHEFVEIHVKCPLATCEQRDPKGLYRKARSGELREFTGIDSVYEEPVDAEIVVATHDFGVDACVAQIMNYLSQTRLITTLNIK